MFTTTLTSLVLLSSSALPEHAAARSLGFSAGALHLFTDDPTVPATAGLLWFESATALVEALDLVTRGGVGLGPVSVGALGTGGAGAVPVLSLETELRWYFPGELVHPFVAGKLLTLYAVTSAGPNLSDLHAGLGARVGLELELSDGVMLWAAPEFDWFVELSRPQRFAVGGSASVAFSW